MSNTLHRPDLVAGFLKTASTMALTLAIAVSFAPAVVVAAEEPTAGAPPEAVQAPSTEGRADLVPAGQAPSAPISTVLQATPSASPLVSEIVPENVRAAADGVVARVRDRLADFARAGGSEREDREALTAHYRDRTSPLWVGTSGLSPQGRAVVSEIERADDWGLSATAFDLGARTAIENPTVDQAADVEIRIGLAILKYARHARGGRLDPQNLSRFFDQKPTLKPATTVLQEVATARAPDAYLRGLHPQHPQFQALQRALVKARAGGPAPLQPTGDGGASIKIADGPTLKAGQQHANIIDLRRRLGVAAGDDSRPDSFDSRLVDAVKSFQRDHDLTSSGHLDKATRAALNKAQKPAAPAADGQRLVANMERWRWLPEDLGAFHVWDNIPEQTARVVKNGQVVHQARIVVGKPDTQTPLFSADMRYVVFHPGWGVPDSIKVKELLPYLRPQQSFWGFSGTDTTVLRRHNLNVTLNGQPVDPSSVNWQHVDIRRYQFVQPPGASNVLGVLKFRFPNKHDVYMHDTSQRDLFQRSQRTYSHGCVRVENPRRLAEVLLDHDRGMPAAEVGRLLTSGPKDNQIELKSKIPVHITYFTAMADPDGTIKTHADFYGHDARVTAALAGRPMGLERAPDATPVVQREVRGAKPVRQAAAKSQSSDFFAGLFGN